MNTLVTQFSNPASAAHDAGLRHIATRQRAEAAGWALQRIFLGTFVATLVALRLLGRVDQSVLIWPVSGVALALALPYWQTGVKRRGCLLGSAAAGFLLAAALLGMPLRIAGMIAVLTCVDVIVAAAILGPEIQAFEDFKCQKNILKFLIAAAVAPLLSGSIGAYPISVFLKISLPHAGLMNLLSSSLGIAIVTPAILLFRRKNKPRLGAFTTQMGKAVCSLLLLVAVTSYVFWQTTNPFLFLVFPPLIVVLLTMGLEGAVFASLVVPLIGYMGTFSNRGPICLAHGSTPLEHLLVLQGFAWICIASALPVGALLDERKRADRSAKESQSIYQVMMQNTDDLMILSSMDGVRRYVSPAVTRLTGWSPLEYLTLDRFQTIHPDDEEIARGVVSHLSVENQEGQFRYRMKRKDGDFLWVEATVKAYGVDGEQIAGYVGTVRDISNLKLVEDRWRQERRSLVQDRQQMADLANTDPLTGLLNRRGLDEKLQSLQDRCQSQTLLMIDVDFFKKYNDTYGHQHGDDCLVRISEVLRSQASRSNDCVARVGGEEFAIALQGADVNHGVRIAEQIRTHVRRLAVEHSASPFGIVTLSVGVAEQTDLAKPDMRALFSRADRALYFSKRKRDCVSAYDAAMDRRTA